MWIYLHADSMQSHAARGDCVVNDELEAHTRRAVHAHAGNSFWIPLVHTCFSVGGSGFGTAGWKAATFVPAMPNAAGNRLSKVAEVGGSLKQVQQAFQTYQVARTQFINSLSVSWMLGCNNMSTSNATFSAMGHGDPILLI